MQSRCFWSTSSRDPLVHEAAATSYKETRKLPWNLVFLDGRTFHSSVLPTSLKDWSPNDNDKNYPMKNRYSPFFNIVFYQPQLYFTVAFQKTFILSLLPFVFVRNRTLSFPKLVYKIKFIARIFRLCFSLQFIAPDMFASFNRFCPRRSGPCRLIEN